MQTLESPLFPYFKCNFLDLDVKERDKIYQVFRKFTDLAIWNQFVRSERGINISDYDFVNIAENCKGNAEEQKYQLVLKWKSRNGMLVYLIKVIHNLM